MNPRRIGQAGAGLTAVVGFTLAAWGAYSASIPELRIYDGFWIMAGSTLAVLLVAPLVWRWPRERSLAIIAIVSVLGSLLPLVISAFRHHIPILARLRGSWMLGGADLVGPPLVIGFVCLWFAVQEHGIERSVSPEAAELGG